MLMPDSKEVDIGSIPTAGRWVGDGSFDILSEMDSFTSGSRRRRWRTLPPFINGAKISIEVTIERQHVHSRSRADTQKLSLGFGLEFLLT